MWICFTKESYTLTPSDEYQVSDKRRLGRLINESRIDSSELKDYIENLEYQNKRISEFLNKLGYTNEAVPDIIITHMTQSQKYKLQNNF